MIIHNWQYYGVGRGHPECWKWWKTFGRSRLCPEPRWGNSQRPPNPVASGEGVAAPPQEPPLSAYGLSVVAQWKIMGAPLDHAPLILRRLLNWRSLPAVAWNAIYWRPIKHKHRLGRALFLLENRFFWPSYRQISTDLDKILHTPIVVRSTLVGRLTPRSACGRLQAKPEWLCFFCNTGTCNAPYVHIHCVSKNPCDYVFDDNLNSKRPIVIIFGTVIT